VVHGREQRVLLAVQPHQRGPQHWPSRQGKGLSCFRDDQPLQLRGAPLGRETRQVDHRQMQRNGVLDHLRRLTFDRLEAGPQHLVPAHHLLERSLQGGKRQSA
jgi:hypothetical protein